MTGEVSNLRDLLGKGKKFASKIVEVEGMKVEVRQPSVGGRSAILKAAGMDGADGSKDLGKLQVYAVLHCAFDPATNKPAFNRADLDSLSAMPAGGWVDDLSAAAIELMNVTPAEDAKNLAETPADNSSLP